MILSLWKYLQGYVVIRVRGYSPERFINLCANKNIYIWNVKKVSDGYVFSISGKAFFMLGPIARKTKCKVKILKKIGLPFKFTKVRKRQYFLYGLIFCVVSIFILSFFVWRIDIEGNETYTTDEILKFLEEQNIKIGSFKPNLNCADIDDLLLMRFENTMWVSSELQGTKFTVYLREGVRYDIAQTEKNPCDIIANKSGTIVSIITRKGTPLVKKGDVVEKGDTLVSGTLEIKELTQLKAVDFTYSDADIYISTHYPYSDVLELTYLEKIYINEEVKEDHALNIFGVYLNFIKPKITVSSHDMIENQEQLKIMNNFYLPIYYNTTKYMPYYQEERKHSIEEAKSKLKEQLYKHLKKLEENNIQILSNDVIFKEDTISVIATGSIYVIEKTGETRLFDEILRRQEYNEYFTEEDGDTP